MSLNSHKNGKTMNTPEKIDVTTADTKWETMTCWEKCSSATICVVGMSAIIVWSLTYFALTVTGITLFSGGCIAISIALLIMWAICWIEEMLCKTIWGIIQMCWDTLFGDEQSKTEGN